MPGQLKFNTRLLNATCNVLGPNTGQDAYGHSTDIAGTTLQTNVPCRKTPGRGAGKEWKSEKQGALADYFVYLMPIAGFTFDEHMWLVIGGLRYNIIDVNDAQIPGAPIEIRVERVKP